MNQTDILVHKPTDELLMGVSAVEEHGQLGLFCQIKLLLKVSEMRSGKTAKRLRIYLKKTVLNQCSNSCEYRQRGNTGILYLFPTSAQVVNLQNINQYWIYYLHYILNKNSKTSSCFQLLLNWRNLVSCNKHFPLVLLPFLFPLPSACL